MDYALGLSWEIATRISAMLFNGCMFMLYARYLTHVEVFAFFYAALKPGEIFYGGVWALKFLFSLLDCLETEFEADFFFSHKFF